MRSKSQFLRLSFEQKQPFLTFLVIQRTLPITGKKFGKQKFGSLGVVGDLFSVFLIANFEQSFLS
jgi:hypothetical protein